MELRRIVIAGTTGFSVMIKRLIEKDNAFKVIGFTTQKNFIKDNIIDGCPVYPEEELHSILNNEEGILNTLGYSRMNTIREKVHIKYENEGFDIVSYISPKANVYTNRIEKGSLILPGAFIGPDVVIGKSCIIYSNVQLTHHINIEDFCFLAANSTVGGNTTIKNNSFIGMNSTIKNKITLASYTLVGCGSNIVNDVTEPYQVLVGNPAKCLNNKNSMETII